MRKPTKSRKVIQRQIDRARRDGVMVVLHPDTVQYLLNWAPVKVSRKKTYDVL